MDLDELLDLPLREVLENYSAVGSLECGYWYGIFNDKDIKKITDNYNIEEEYPEAFGVMNLIDDELILDCDEIGDYDKLVRIMENLGINKKGESNGKND